MCGIAGFIDFKQKATNEILKNMTDVLHHRGPDDSGYSFFEDNSYHIGFGHRRLSVLDLSRHGHQPMQFQHFEIVYNGEVYNFKEIRRELEKYRYTFDSDSDTEVILKAYDKWGIKAVDKFNGMFVISIYDKLLKKIIIIRDRAGVKPLYWYWKDETFLFSSELKSFHKYPSFKKEINLNSLSLYLKYGYILQPHTIFKQTYKLKSGHYLEVNLKTKDIKEQCYWNVIDYYNKSKLDISENEAINEMEALLKSSFNYRMVSDVPVGVFLSGGYDSSAVTALLQKENMNKIKTFTIGFNEKGFDEAPYAKEIASYLGTNHTEYYCTSKEAVEIIPTLAEIYDEPFGDASAIPTILVSKLAKKDVTVALSADGGDETFAGYGKYARSLKYLKFLEYNSISRKVLQSSLRTANSFNLFSNNYQSKIGRIVDTLQKKENESILKLMKQFDDNSLDKLLLNGHQELETSFDVENQIQNEDKIDRMLAIDYKTYMVDDILTKVDRATMSVSLEGREPLLDYRIIELAAQLPSSFKYNDGTTKDILKKIVHKYIPKNMIDRAKMGFGVPLHEWFQDDLKIYIKTYLSSERLQKEAIFNIYEVEQLKKNYFNNPHNKSLASKIWFLLVFEMWYEKWM